MRQPADMAEMMASYMTLSSSHDGRPATRTVPGEGRAGLGPGGVKQEVGPVGGKEADEQSDHGHVVGADPAAGVLELTHDVHDRSSGESEEEDRHRRALELVAEDGACERRPTTDDPEQAEKAPRRPQRDERSG